MKKNDNPGKSGMVKSDRAANLSLKWIVLIFFSSSATIKRKKFQFQWIIQGLTTFQRKVTSFEGG